MIIAGFVTAEIFLLCASAFMLFRLWHNTFAESLSYAIITVFMLLSFIHQIAFITGIEWIDISLEILFFAASVILIIKNRQYFLNLFNILKNFSYANPKSCLLLFLCFLYMGIQSFLPLPEYVSKNSSDFFSINHLLLFNTFSRFQTDFGIGIFSFLAYFSIFFSTYALCRRYSSQPTAFTVTILVISMPRLVLHATSAGTEIISVAVALFCILAIYKTVEKPNIRNLIWLIWGISFCISEDIGSIIFTLILISLACLILFRRHGWLLWKSILIKNRFYVLCALLPAIIFSHGWFFLSNSFSDVVFNENGIQGAFTAFIRYIYESINFTAPVNVTHSWFGPAGFFLVIPALLYAMIKGPRRLKAIATAFIGYFYLISLIMAWSPGNAKFFGLFYVCAGFTIAFLFPPWRFTERVKNTLQTIGFSLLIFTLFSSL